MERKCKYDGKPIPPLRKATAKYCSDACYYESKKKRSNDRYHWLKDNSDTKVKNEKLLAQFYSLIGPEHKVPTYALHVLHFDWGYCDTERQDENGNIWKIIGPYAYRLLNETTIIIILWKR